METHKLELSEEEAASREAEEEHYKRYHLDGALEPTHWCPFPYPIEIFSTRRPDEGPYFKLYITWSLSYGKIEPYKCWRDQYIVGCTPMVRIDNVVGHYEETIGVQRGSSDVFWGPYPLQRELRFWELEPLCEAAVNGVPDENGDRFLEIEVVPAKCEKCDHRHIGDNCFATGLGETALFGRK
ncbi:hypothetical protein TWF281_004747 [Arthrobotrys megalospora]